MVWYKSTVRPQLHDVGSSGQLSKCITIGKSSEKGNKIETGSTEEKQMSRLGFCSLEQM